MSGGLTSPRFFCYFFSVLWEERFFRYNMREARKAESLSQTALADAMGVSRSLVAMLESGEVAPSVQRLLELAAALDVEPQWLLQDHGYAPADA